MVTDNSEYLSHHGILGMKWGIRRYQNKDGSLTNAGKKKAARMRKQYTELTGKKLRSHPEYSKESSGKKAKESKKKSISEMSDSEIQAKINRLKLEKQLNELSPKQVSRGRKIANAILSSAGTIARDKGTKIAGDLIDKKLRDSFGLNDTKQPSASEQLRKEADDAQNRYRRALAEDNLKELRKKQKQN